MLLSESWIYTEEPVITFNPIKLQKVSAILFTPNKFIGAVDLCVQLTIPCVGLKSSKLKDCSHWSNNYSKHSAQCSSLWTILPSIFHAAKNNLCCFIGHNYRKLEHALGAEMCWKHCGNLKKKPNKAFYGIKNANWFGLRKKLTFLKL